MTVLSKESGEEYKKLVSAYAGQNLRPWVATQTRMSMKISDNFTYTTTITSEGEVALVTDGGATGAPASGAGNGDVGGGGAVDEIKNTISGALVKAEDDGNINFEGGVSYKNENFTTGPAVSLTAASYIARISSNTITTVNLPAITAGAKSKKYIVLRDYPLQGGETPGAPVLNVVAAGGNTIDGLASIGLAPGIGVRLVSDGVSTWRIP